VESLKNILDWINIPARVGQLHSISSDLVLVFFVAVIVLIVESYFRIKKKKPMPKRRLIFGVIAILFIYWTFGSLSYYAGVSVQSRLLVILVGSGMLDMVLYELLKRIKRSREYASKKFYDLEELDLAKLDKEIREKLLRDNPNGAMNLDEQYDALMQAEREKVATRHPYCLGEKDIKLIRFAIIGSLIGYMLFLISLFVNLRWFWTTLGISETMSDLKGMTYMIIVIQPLSVFLFWLILLIVLMAPGAPRKIYQALKYVINPNPKTKYAN
jgi:hypothetical protein